MITEIIQAAAANFTVTFLLAGLLCAALSLINKPKPVSRAVLVEALFSYFLLFSIGITYLYNFVFHVFFQEMTAPVDRLGKQPFSGRSGLCEPWLQRYRLPCLQGKFRSPNCSRNGARHASCGEPREDTCIR